MRREFDREIVLVASKPPRPQGRYKSLMSSLDIAKSLSNRILLRALRQLDRRAFYYDNVDTFVRNIDLHREHLVVPYYYAVGSRINYGYVQSICESVEIRFVGPEAYALTVCNDKVLSKDICRSQGLRTPRCAVFYAQNDCPALEVLETPLIVKPVFEGNSIGITRDSVCPTADAARMKATALYSKIRAPVMVEEFLEGTEVNVCLLQDGKGGYRINAVALNKSRAVYDYRQKHFRWPLGMYKPYQSAEIESNFESLLNIAKMLGKLEFMRFDCVISAGQLFCVELSPDADLSINSALYLSVAHEMDYNDFVRQLIDNAIESYRSRSTN
jgi:D-alanine-D-alanine ligase